MFRLRISSLVRFRPLFPVDQLRGCAPDGRYPAQWTGFVVPILRAALRDYRRTYP